MDPLRRQMNSAIEIKDLTVTPFLRPIKFRKRRRTFKMNFFLLPIPSTKD